MTRVLLGLTVFFAGCSVAPVAEPHPQPAVSVAFQPQDSMEAAAIEAMASVAVSRIESFFALDFARPPAVVILPDRAAFDEHFRAAWGIPETACWMVGAAGPDALVLLSPRVWSEQACEHDGRDSAHVGGIVAHELVHVLHGQYNPTDDFEGMDPLGWFVEGLAVLASGQLAEHRGDAGEALAGGAWPTRLEDVWSGRYRYGLAGSLVEHVDRSHGRDMLRRMLAATSQAQALELLGETEERLLASWATAVAP